MRRGLIKSIWSPSVRKFKSVPARLQHGGDGRGQPRCLAFVSRQFSYFASALRNRLCRFVTKEEKLWNQLN